MVTDHDPPLRHPPLDRGDAWVVAPSGERYWGRFGAAGLLAVDDERGVLLQHRAAWSHHGDTWGLPGGARHEHEPVVPAALREAAEEAGVPTAAVRPWCTDVADRGVWAYATVVAEVVAPFEATISDPESRGLAWVPPDEVASRPLHPGFEASWGRLRGLLRVRPAIVVDAANVVGSVPDGWWRDRAGAATRLLARLAALASAGVPAAALDLPGHTWFPEWTVVLEGRAKGAADVPGLQVVRADEAGDDRIVHEARRLLANDRRVTVVTSDRGLATRLHEVGARVIAAGRLLDLLD